MTVENKTIHTYRKPKRVFEKSGMVNPEMSYYVPLENVVNTDNQDIQTMIDRGRYFSIFAPRQSGKTTFFKETCRQLHRDPTYVTIKLSFQDYKSLNKSQFYALIQQELYEQLLLRLEEVNCEKTNEVKQFLKDHHLTDHISFRLLFEKLNQLIQFKKIVIFIDEFDGIPVSELENFLTSIRGLYQKYKEVKQKALYSVGLVGIRNITKLVVGGVSPFNIADQVQLPSFSLENVRRLYQQYTEETNQPFTQVAVKKVYEETAGQTWLVNRLATILTINIKPATIEPINEKDVETAIRVLLSERNDHFDNLYEKAKEYKETFVQVVFDHVKYRADHEDLSCLEQHGLIKKKGDLAVVANNIYKARYVETFFDEVNVSLSGEIPITDYLLPNGSIDMKRLLLNFNQYIAQIGVNAFHEKKKPYEKTGEFLLTAFLYQFAGKGKGELRYQVKTGLGIMDIILTYNERKYIIETKVNRFDDITVIQQEGITQLTGKYLAPEAVDEGFLVIFDTKTHVGALCTPQVHQLENHKITSFKIGIGRPG
ncbi:MAG: AAA-like domain-containing protein [Candidatus Aminicenantes bacterium]|nr:MAG: AAA-like domain-containing protein [Candidatus Aminicenantes bacterium]